MNKINIDTFVKMQIGRLTHFGASTYVLDKNLVLRTKKEWYRLFKDINSAFDLAEILTKQKVTIRQGKSFIIHKKNK